MTTPNHHMERALSMRDRPGASTRARVLLARPELADVEAPLDRSFPTALSAGPLREACLMAVAFKSVPHADGCNIGRTLRRLVKSDRFSDATATPRLVAVSRQQWPAAVVSIRSILAAAATDHVPTDWHDLAWTARGWDSADHARDMRRWALSFSELVDPSDRTTDGLSAESTPEIQQGTIA